MPQLGDRPAARCPVRRPACPKLVALLAARRRRRDRRPSDANFDAKNPPIGFTLALTGVQDIIFVFAAYITVKLALGHARPEDFGLRRVAKWWSAIGWMVLVIVGFFADLEVLSEVFGKPPDQDLVTDVKQRGRVRLPARLRRADLSSSRRSCEELFFRGFMFAGLRNRMSLWPAAAISSILWASLHLSGGNLGVVAILAVFGLFLAWLYERSGTIWAGSSPHGLNNAIAVTYLRHELTWEATVSARGVPIRSLQSAPMSTRTPPPRRCPPDRLGGPDYGFDGSRLQGWRQGRRPDALEGVGSAQGPEEGRPHGRQEDRGRRQAPRSSRGPEGRPCSSTRGSRR